MSCSDRYTSLTGITALVRLPLPSKPAVEQVQRSFGLAIGSRVTGAVDQHKSEVVKSLYLAELPAVATELQRTDHGPVEVGPAVTVSRRQLLNARQINTRRTKIAHQWWIVCFTLLLSSFAIALAAAPRAWCTLRRPTAAAAAAGPLA